MGVVGSRWAPRSSKPVTGRVAGRGGFDSHPLPPLFSTLNVMHTPDTDTLTPLVRRVLNVSDITTGAANQSFLVRYRGLLYRDSEQAYDDLTQWLQPYGLMPLFRKEDGQHVIYLTQDSYKTRPSNPWVNLVLFLLTVFSVMFAGVMYTYDGPLPEDPGGMVLTLLRNLHTGIPFAASLLGILLAHEFGHYLAGRYHGAHVTLPYFLPLPISPFGTMGAFINMKKPPKNKRILLDIGIAGPLAGLVVALPVLLYGLSLSRVDTISVPPGSAFQLEGNSILYLLAKYAVFGEWLPAPADYGGLSPILYWLRYFFTSQPLPIGGMDVMIHPVAWAGWAGLLVTALNLVPAGQLDGGHLVYVLLGQRSKKLWPFIMVSLALLGLAWSGWWLWAVLLFFLGRFYAEPLDQITGLDKRRKWIAVLGVIIFFLVFTPVPLVYYSTAI